MTEHAHHPTHPHTQTSENGLAIAAFILGIVSLTGLGALAGVPAIITGIMSLKNPVNKGLGIAGLVMGSIATVLTICVIMFFFFVILMAAMSDTPHDYPQPMPYGNGSASGHMRSI